MEQVQVKIFDTTLRDGQQCPGAAMSFENNLAYAQLAHKCGIDVIEAGFPAASKLDHAIVKTIAEELAGESNSPVIAALCQLRENQIDSTIEALLPAVRHQKARLHTYLPVDPVLMQASLGERANNKSQFISDLHRFTKRAVEAGMEVEFSPEGYSRLGDNFDFVADLIRATVEAGATIINCPDTIGGAYRLQGDKYYVNYMIKHAAIINKEFPDSQITWSVHCHNDFGLAVENSLQAVFFGPATQIEGCINGIGERAGNAALEQCIMIINQFGCSSDLSKQFTTAIKTESLQQISDFVDKHMLPRQPHWPICGGNAAKHSAGGHTNAIINNPLAYQPFDPRQVGKEISFLFSPLSGSNHAQAVIETAGFVCAEDEKTEISQFIKDLYADRRKGITDQELLEGYFKYRAPITVDEFDYSKSGNQASIRLVGCFFGTAGTLTESFPGRDSALTTLKKAIDKHFHDVEIDYYSSESIGSGTHAQSLSSIIIKDQSGAVFKGSGIDQDIEISAMKALIDAINQAYIHRNFRLGNDSTQHN